MTPRVHYNIIQQILSRKQLSQAMPGETAWSRVSVSPEPAAEHSTTFAVPAVSDALTLSSLSLEALRNASAHRTRRFELVRLSRPVPVLRRGQHFDVVIKFNEQRPFDLEKDSLRLVFSFGQNPNAVKGTQGVVSILNDSSECWPVHDGRWYGRLKNSDSNETELEIRPSADAPIGVWRLKVETGVKEESSAIPKVYEHKEQIYLLFNPWVKDDATFMEKQALLDEYVLQDVGKIWVGTYQSHWGRQWVFGQFDKAVLPAAMFVLERANLDPTIRGNPIAISRAISKLVNSNDDAGVLVGNWSGNYAAGTAPGAWTGSVKILEQYHSTKQPVQFGQCWVFAGVTTTICRALGLPSRVVTNLVSAHDSNASLTVDKYFDYNSRPLDTGDSIWNFHVWNEAWMARPDLPKGYGGWQAIDATPQETSDGVYQCGPASLQAIRQGSVGFKYDVQFLISSVNADVVYWKQDPTAEIGYRRMNASTAEVGRKILTKQANVFDATGQADMEDITWLYKAKEGSQLERSTMYNAARGSTNARRYLLQPGEAREDLVFTLNDLDKINVGDKFEINVTIKNEVDDARTLDVTLCASSVYYNGVEANLIKKAAGKFKIRPRGRDVLRLEVTPTEYLPKLVEYGMMKIFAVATVLETKQTWAAEDDFQIVKPKISVKVPEKVVAKQVSSLEFTLKNPLKTTLHNCKLQYEGPHVLTSNVTIDMDDIGPEEEITVKGDVTPVRKGKFGLVAVFSSDELHDVTGSASVENMQVEDGSRTGASTAAASGHACVFCLAAAVLERRPGCERPTTLHPLEGAGRSVHGGLNRCPLEMESGSQAMTTEVGLVFSTAETWNATFENNSTEEMNSFYFYQTEQVTVLWILFVLIVLGNSAVLAALLLDSKGRKSRMNFFIMHLAFADLSVGLISVLTDIVWRITVTWHAGHVACKLIRFSQGMVTYSSTYVLVVLSIDRYDAITHPMNFSGSCKHCSALFGGRKIASDIQNNFFVQRFLKLFMHVLYSLDLVVRKFVSFF
ncbi:Hypothetical predicted protein [Cloeon dipterum]|uniref:protein-glutamine gamma-glutamyltransferase n=1 Tax=Cloeon dipterum TaxID=197152 RepID=A0A8S1CUU4_9INSE|nr:Hypothetical predicted protein [Cloeon dipterum]